MDTPDVLPLEENNLFEVVNTDSSWTIENNPTSNDDLVTGEETFDLFRNEESSPMQIFNKKREEELATKTIEENEKIGLLREQAKADLEKWYNDRQRQVDQKSKAKENDLQIKVSKKDSCDWSEVLNLIDFTDGKQLTKSKRDLTRMKECLFNAKRYNEQKKLSNGI